VESGHYLLWPNDMHALTFVAVATLATAIADALPTPLK
jgi:hypothetical protein